MMRWKLMAVLGVVTLVMAGCGTDGPTPEAAPAVLNVTAVDDGEGGGYAFELPSTVTAGASRISLRNSGTEPHHAQLFALAPDATVDDLMGALQTGDPEAMLEFGVFDGGTGMIDPGTTSAADAIVDLQEGTYVFMCFIENAEGLPHLAGGMVQSFEVTAGDDGAAMPEFDAEVGLTDTEGGYAFDVPEAIAGDDVLQIVNRSEAEPHELNALRLADGAEVSDIFEFFGGEVEGPPPFSGVGGMQALVPGGQGTLQLDLEPGRYTFICFIPDAEGVPHAASGMVAEVEVS